MSAALMSSPPSSAWRKRFARIRQCRSLRPFSASSATVLLQRPRAETLLPLINYDVADVALIGQEVTGLFSVLGIPNFDQAARTLQFNLNKSIQGNTYIDFETSVRAIGIQPGDIVAPTYLKEGFNRQPFRVIGITPGTNYRTALITVQLQDDSWYTDTNGQTPSNGRRQPDSSVGLPRPLIGSVVDSNGDVQFGIVEISNSDTDGGLTVQANVSFIRSEERRV